VSTADAVAGKAFLEVVDWGGLVVGLAELAGCVGLAGLWVLNLAWAESATMWDLAAVTAGWEIGGVDCWSGSSGAILVTGWNINDVELAAGGLLRDELLGWVVRDMVAIDDVVVPVARTELQGVGALEAESTLP